MKYLAPFLFSLASAASAQPQAGSAAAPGTCGIANTGSSNNFNITCGIGKQQGGALLKIMNKILASQLDPDAVMKSLTKSAGT